jgi:hypothetical protein
MAAKRATGVDEVANKIEVLPTSQNDNRIRRATFYRIYTDDFLARYAPGGVYGVLQELRDERRFPGMQPVGRYPIHIIVKNGRIMLLGVVDNATDRQLAEVRAREVTGVFEVENSLTLIREGQEEAASESLDGHTGGRAYSLAATAFVSVVLAGVLRTDAMFVASAEARPHHPRRAVRRHASHLRKAPIRSHDGTESHGRNVACPLSEHRRRGIPSNTL